MTYRDSLPQGAPFNGHYSQNVQQGFDAWGNPQYPTQYPNTTFAPAVYSSNQANNYTNNHQHHQHHPQQQQQQQQQPQQQQQEQRYSAQLHSYDPAFDQRPYQPSPPSNVNIVNPPAHVPASAPRHVPHANPQNHYAHPQMSWQPMPPPMPSHSPSYQHQPSAQLQAQAALPPQPLQSPHQHHLSQHANSPVMAQSPQFSSQFIQSSNGRTASVGARVDHVNRVSASPRLTSAAATRSPSVSSMRSPVTTPGLIPHHADTNSLLVCVAEDLFRKAREESFSVADNMDAQGLQDYHKLVATGLGCLEAVLASNKLQPRLEARIRLRYASILCDETNNVMEAETALTKGITLCERNRFADLKYAMQYLQVMLLSSQGKDRAAMIAMDARIRDAEVVKHTHWVYAFRFLKASMYLQSAHPTDTHALENLKAITHLAAQRGDRAIFVAASLLEGLGLLKTMKDDAVVRIQACLAQSSKYQLEDSIRIPQLEILALMLDLACSLHQKSPATISQKLRALQHRMDASIDDNQWGLNSTELLIPVRRQPSGTHVVSADTSAVLRPGLADEASDYVVMSFWSKIEAFTMTYAYSGLALLYQQPRNDRRIFQLWEESLSQLKNNAKQLRGTPNSLQDAIRSADWRRELNCYLHILRGLHLATYTRWQDVQKCIQRLEQSIRPPMTNIIVLYSMYLAGVYRQGTGALDMALAIYSHESFDLQAGTTTHEPPTAAEREVGLLAMFNRIWIMQHPSFRDDILTRELLDQIRPLCTGHPNLEIRVAYNLVLAAIQTNPPIPMTAVKTHISTALNTAKVLGDVQTLSIALNLMRAKLFQSIVGDQALKSAKAASTQARKSGNTLWMSVADGMLAQSYEVQGQALEAQSAWHDAVTYASQAVKREVE